jgi:hypothetical protein
VSRDFGATVVYPCHNSQSEGATSPRKRVLFFIYSPVTVKTHLKMAIPPCQVCRHNRPSFVVCSSSRRFFLAAILVFVSSIFFPSINSLNLHNSFDCLYFLQCVLLFFFSFSPLF